eukprot:6213937-Pleurochrysis_carterae.AAC.6
MPITYPRAAGETGGSYADCTRDVRRAPRAARAEPPRRARPRWYGNAGDFNLFKKKHLPIRQKRIPASEPRHPDHNGTSGPFRTLPGAACPFSTLALPLAPSFCALVYLFALFLVVLRYR